MHLFTFTRLLCTLHTHLAYAHRLLAVQFLWAYTHFGFDIHLLGAFVTSSGDVC